MKIAFYTLGCKVNQFETQAMEQLCLARGHTLVPFEAPGADAYIVNSCTVTALADKKTRNALRRAKKENPRAVIALCGCYGQRADVDESDLPAGLLRFGNRDHVAVLNAVQDAFCADCDTKKPPGGTFSDTGFEDLPAGSRTGRTRALLKIQDGCDNFCSYCIIPHVRGRVRSMPLAALRAQAQSLAAQGFREIVITGIEISSYGKDTGDTLTDALRAVLEAAPAVRVRLGSLEPRTITPAFCEALAPYPNLCPHFHLSLQSGCDAVLARMNRKYTTAQYAAALALLRRHFSGCAITTDLICGFPGESEAQFAQTLAFVADAGFSQIHVFPYSRRKGTAAAAFAKQVPMAVRRARAAQAAQAAQAARAAFFAAQIGQIYEVLPEKAAQDGSISGYTPNYLPVLLERAHAVKNVPVTVRICGQKGDFLIGMPISHDNTHP